MDGIRIISLADPENPVEYPYLPTPDAHDIYARNDTVYIAEGFNGTFSVYDLTDKSNPVLLARKVIPSAGYVHNKTVKVWDISDLSGITLLGQYLGNSRLAHNALIRGNKIFISHYTYGVSVVDISDPTNPLEIAHYDTYPYSNDSDYAGCWGVDPYTDNNYVYASNTNGRLYILRYDSTTNMVYERVVRGNLNLDKGDRVYDVLGRLAKPKGKGIYIIRRANGKLEKVLYGF